LSSTIAEARAEAVRRPGLDGPGRRTCLTEVTDTWLNELFAAAVREIPVRAALIAVGSHGSRDLSVGSDLDLVLLHQGNEQQARALAEALWYPIWDAGLALDHSVRTLGEARTIAAHDVKVMLGLLDARVVAGDDRLGAHLRETVLIDWRAMATRRFPELEALVERRRSQFGDLAQMLEPDLKEAYGGLREANIVRAIRASWVVEVPHSGWQVSAHWLRDVRDALHAVTGRRADVLPLQDQGDVAEALGLADADALLRSVYEAGRKLAYASDVAWYRVNRAIRQNVVRRSRSSVERQPLAHGVVLHEGEVVLAQEADPSRDPGLVLRAAAAAGQAGWPVAHHTLERLATSSIDEPWSDEIRASFVRLLGSGPSLIATWEALDQVGIIDQLLPEWSVVRSAPQRNPIHRFTVDRHLIETTVQASALTRTVERPDLLLLGALLHDIGKGHPGDHSVVGAELTERITARMGLEPADAVIVQQLVRHHLLLPEIATTRDLDDPRTIERVVETVSDPTTLELLGALSQADARATGPAASSDWRLTLIGDLTVRALNVARGAAAVMQPSLREVEQLALDQEGVWVLIEDAPMGCTVSVAAPDASGLLATVAAVLALHRLQVHAARVQTVGDRALQTWRVSPLFGEPPPTSLLAEEIRRALDGTTNPGAVVRGRAKQASPPRRTAFPDPWVRVDTEHEPAIVEVRAHDRPGLLHTIADALSNVGIDIEGAIVDTLGSDVVDVFFVSVPGTRGLDHDHADAITTQILQALGERLP
jgi:[protein-PII] uridylyltransferase